MCIVLTKHRRYICDVNYVALYSKIQNLKCATESKHFVMRISQLSLCTWALKLVKFEN